MIPDDCDNDATYHTCVIKSDRRETVIPKEAVLRELKRCRFGEKAVFAVRLALEEALTNALRHGNQFDPHKLVTIRFSVTPEKAVIIVRDQGPGFEPECIPDPTCDERLNLPCGRGITLMRAYMDEVEYRDRGREIFMVKRGKRSKRSK